MMSHSYRCMKLWEERVRFMIMGWMGRVRGDDT